MHVSRRFTTHTPAGNPIELSQTSTAAVEGRTRYPARVVHPFHAPRVLVDGINNRKIGNRVAKGHHKGKRIFTLTLEERATCWDGCRHYLTCYGNAMHWPRRHVHGAELEMTLDGEIAALLAKHDNGILVRLHVLGDFFSPTYVGRWKAWLQKHPRLSVYGYTGWPPPSEIGQAITDMVSEIGWARCAIRFSNSDVPVHGAGTVTNPALRGRQPEGIICPVQTGAADCCGTCGLCWNGEENVAFIEH